MYRKSYIVQFNFYSRKGKLRKEWKLGECTDGTDCKGTEVNTFGAGNVLFHNFGDVCMTAFLCTPVSMYQNPYLILLNSTGFKVDLLKFIETKLDNRARIKYHLNGCRRAIKTHVTTTF